MISGNLFCYFLLLACFLWNTTNVVRVYGEIGTSHFEKNITMDNKIAIYGSEISNATTGSKIECASKCLLSVSCKYVSFRENEKRCILYRNTMDKIQMYDIEIGWESYNIQDTCRSGFLDTFTKYENSLHIANDILTLYPSGSTVAEKIDECRRRCLNEPTCRAFEMRFSSVCTLEAINVYDRSLDYSTDYTYYNRDYDCGCPPTTPNGTIISYSNTTDGSNATYVCPQIGINSTLTCTSDGWGTPC